MYTVLVGRRFRLPLNATVRACLVASPANPKAVGNHMQLKTLFIAKYHALTGQLKLITHN